MQEVANASRLALALALAAASPAVPAVVLGEAEARSALGEALDARIPFTIPAGSSVDASCFALIREPGDGSQGLGEGVLTIERRRGEAALRIRTLAPVFEPVLSLRVRAACPGSEGAGTRQYSLLLDPRPGSALAIALPLAAAQLNAREGDSLESMASKIHPRNSDARARYLTALRALNPQLAAQGEGTPIAAGTPIALPDLRALPPRVPATRLARAPAPPRERPAKREPAAPKASKTAEPRVAAVPAPPVTQRAERRRAAEPRGASSAGFVLKLSSAEVDLSRSRKIDDRMRAQLRERLLVLDADDQVAAMLSMRNSLKQLEARVAEMQLKLDAMPASLAARGTPMPTPAPAIAAPAPATPAAPPAAAKVPPQEVRAEPPAAKIEPALPAAEPAPRIEPPIAKVEPPPPKPEPVPSKPEPAAAKPASPPPAYPPGVQKVVRTPKVEEGLPEWLWAAAALALVVAAFLAWRLLRRRKAQPADEWAAQVQAEPVEPTVQGAALPNAVFAEEPIEVAPEVRPELQSDAALSTRLPENSSELRRRYIEERFPEVQNRTIALEDPTSVIKAARLFYEDGAIARSVELLQFAVDENPGEVRTWLALFEIFRLERLSGEFATLAERFREHHAKSDSWRKVQYFGREIDPGNALYREEPVNTLETIGPREAKRLAAGLSSVGPAANFDPIAENWLNAPMDFENEVLANELRRKLMAEASLTEPDLASNPMPALRSVDMFNVA